MRSQPGRAAPHRPWPAARSRAGRQPHGARAPATARVRLAPARRFEARDCLAGQCVFEDGHPVSYAGLEGHGNYFDSSPLEVYEYVNLTVS